MKLARSIKIGTFATLALAGSAAVSHANLIESIVVPHCGVIVTASALHTGVHPRVRSHHARPRHMHRPHAELRAAAGHPITSHRAPSTPLPSRRPARSHATLPHTPTKLHRSHSRGGA